MKTLEKLLWLGWTWFLIGTIWRIAEIALYGDVQPCQADGIAAMLYVTAIVIGYKLGVKHGKESSCGDL